MQEKHHLAIDNALIELGQKIVEQSKQINQLKEEKAGLLIYFYFLQYRIHKTLVAGSELERNRIERSYQKELEKFVQTNQETLAQLENRIKEALGEKDYILLGQLSARAQTIREHEEEQKKELETKKISRLEVVRTNSGSKELKRDKLTKLSDRSVQLAEKIEQSNVNLLKIGDELNKTVDTASEKTRSQLSQLKDAAKPKLFHLKKLPVSAQQFFRPPTNPLEILRKKSQDVQQSGRVSEEEAKNLLKEIGKGHLNEVKTILQSNYHLLHAMREMVDVTDKTYKDITVLQYAYIVGDIDMCEMILEQFKAAGNEGMIRYQLNAEVIQSLGGVYTLKETLEAYEAYIKNYDQWNNTQREEHWCKKIGGCQQTWPAWLRYDIAENGYEALWCKQTVCGRPQKRDSSVYGLEDKNSWSEGGDGSKYKLGENFAWWRGKHWRHWIQTSSGIGIRRGGYGSAEEDQKGLNTEEAAIKGYRASLAKEYQFEAESETLKQEPTLQPAP